MRELACLGHSNTLASETCQFQSLRRRQKGFEEWVEEVGTEKKEKQEMLITQCKSHCKLSSIAVGAQTGKAAIARVAMRRPGRGYLILPWFPLSVASPSLESKMYPENTNVLSWKVQVQLCSLHPSFFAPIPLPTHPQKSKRGAIMARHLFSFLYQKSFFSHLCLLCFKWKGFSY